MVGGGLGGRAGVGKKGTTPLVRREGGRRSEGGEGVMHVWCVVLGQRKLHTTHPATSLCPSVWYLCFSRPVRLTATTAGECLGCFCCCGMMGDVGLSETEVDALTESTDTAAIPPRSNRDGPRVDVITSTSCHTCRRY